MTRSGKSLSLAVALVAAQLAWAPVALAEGDCHPPCRDGFVCHQGRCMSACNPPCGPGEVCVEGRRCEAVPVSTPPPAPTEQGGVPIVDHSQAGGSQVVVIEDSGSGYPPPSGVSQAHAQPQAYPQVPPQEPAYEDPFFAIHANLIGFLFFGPVVSLEMGGSLSGQLRLRFPNAGLINVAGLDVDIYDSEEISFGIAVGGAARYYLSSRGTMRGFYLGAALDVEYSEWYVEECDTSFDCQELDEELTRLMTVAQLGWRWGFRSFFFGVGGELGYASVLGYSRYDRETGTEDRAATHDGTVFGMIALELGFYL